MALTNNNLAMIKALANNDVHSARVAALASLTEDTSKKNAPVVSHYKRLLSGSPHNVLLNLPQDLKTVLVGEVPSGFSPDRYYIRPEEKAVAEQIYTMKLVAQEMSDRKIPYRNTTLLTGESGTGKTEFGRYIAYKLNLPFFYISFVATIDSYLGSTAKNLHKVFEFCNSIPCVLMLDEVDCVASRREARGSRGADGELERTTISLMQELDRLPNHVTLIAATNRPDMLDEALARRFSISHEIRNMTQQELDGMIRQYLRATDTESYVSEEQIQILSTQYQNPGQVMPELIRTIGNQIFEEKKDSILLERESNEMLPDLWEVTYTWKTNIAAATEEDAIALAQRQRNEYRTVNATVSEYTAKRAEYIPPTTK